MILQERTSPNNFQSILTCNKEIDKTKVKLIIKLNLLSRLYSSIKSDLTRLEFLNKILPLLKLKISEFSTDKNKFFIANLNRPMSNIQPSKPVSEKLEKTFSDIGIELPSTDILKDRLDSFSEDDTTDPFRLMNVDLRLSEFIDLKDLTWADLKNAQFDFEDTFYANTNFNEKLYYDKVKATSILALNDIIKTEKDFSLTKDIVETILKDIKDKNIRLEMEKDLMLFVNNPNVRPKMIMESQKHLKLNPVRDNKGKPIETWKIVTVVTLAITGLLAYTFRDQFKK